MEDLLKQVLLKGKIETEKDFKIVWFHCDKIKKEEPYNMDYSERVAPHMIINLREGIAAIALAPITDMEHCIDTYCKYTYKANEPIIFYDKNGLFHNTYEELQRSYAVSEIEYYKTYWSDVEFTIGELNSHCENQDDWNKGLNLTHFMDEGLIKIKDLSIGNGTMTIYAKIEPLWGYEVVEIGWEYFKDFPVKVTDIIGIEEKQEV